MPFNLLPADYDYCRLKTVMKCVSNYQYLQICMLELSRYESFLPLKVVGHGSWTQLQVGENLNKITYKLG